jgi:hypothetical protein
MWLKKLLKESWAKLEDYLMKKYVKDPERMQLVKNQILIYPGIHWEGIMIHHSLTKDGVVKDWDAIKRYHIETMGWKDIGYHLGIEWVFDHYEYQIGRPLNMPGAHCKENGQNTKTIGICLVGNYDLAPPSKEQLKLLGKLCRELMAAYKINIENIRFHRQYATYKSCPGTLLSKSDILKAIGNV